MIAVCIWWNTNPDGSPVDFEGLDLDDIPKSYYGPFDSIQHAIDWMNDDYPDGDTDVYDMIADIFDIPAEWANDPNDVKEEVFRPEVNTDPQEIQGS